MAYLPRSVVPVLLVTGAKDSGKTSLAVELVARLTRRGRDVYAFKRASDVHDVSEPGSDTMRLAAAGAAAIGLTWPSGTYVASCAISEGRPLTPGDASRVHRLDNPSSLDDIVRLAHAVVPPSVRAVVIAEGFSDSLYARIHVVPRPGGPERPARGPVLTTWSLDPAHDDPAEVAELVEMSLPHLADWTLQAARPDLMPAAVLAGGRGRRLGGIDKWSLDVGGLSQGERCLGAVRATFARVAVVGRGRSHGPRASGEIPSLKWVADLIPGSGPLGGLFTALELSPGEPVFAVAGDMPFLSPALMSHMLFEASRMAGDYDVLVPRWGEFREPLHAIYGPACRARLRGMLAEAQHGLPARSAPAGQDTRSGEAAAIGAGASRLPGDPPSWNPLAGRRMTDLFEGLRVREITEDRIRLFGDPKVLFLNLNTPEDLASAERILGAGD